LSARAVSTTARARRAGRSTQSAPARTPPHRQKKLCTGGLCGRIDGLGGAQNVRISANRFAPTGCLPLAFGCAWRRRARNFRFHFGTTRQRRGDCALRTTAR